jgi:DNA-directed RNA polymerase subunit M/transcription elongation factor TFIIS
VRRDQLQQVRADVIADPTLPREKVDCTVCGKKVEAVHFLAPLSDSDVRFRIIYVCTKCANKWG